MYTPPVTLWELVIPEVDSLTFLEGVDEGRISDWSEVVTRYPYRKVGMDHLLSMEYKNQRKQPFDHSGLAYKVRKWSKTY